MSQMHVTRRTRLSTAVLILLVPILILLIAAPWWAGRADLRLMGEIALYMSLATLWNLLAGYAGLVSVGQQAYVGLGGYLFFALTMLAGIDPYVALPLAALAGAVIGVSPAPASGKHRKARIKHFCRIGAGPGRVERRMLQQPDLLCGPALRDSRRTRLHMVQSRGIVGEAV